MWLIGSLTWLNLLNGMFNCTNCSKIITKRLDYSWSIFTIMSYNAPGIRLVGWCLLIWYILHKGHDAKTYTLWIDFPFFQDFLWRSEDYIGARKWGIKTPGLPCHDLFLSVLEKHLSVLCIHVLKNIIILASEWSPSNTKISLVCQPYA